MKKFWALLLITAVFIVSGCGSAGNGKTADGKITVAASFYPMAEFARAVGGSHAEVYTMIGDGIEPHDWEPSARDLTRLAKAKVFVYNGGVEPWAQPALDAVAEEGVLPVEAGQAFMAEQNSRLDPHFWLSPRKAETEVLAVRDAFIKADPANAAAYEKNAADYIERLKELGRKMAAVTQNAQIKTFVTTHAAFGHLAADYGLKQISIMGLSPQSEPSPAALNKLVGVMHAENIKYVFFETLVSPRIAESIAAEAGARTLVLDPIEGLSGEGRRSGDDYLKIMERNIKNLEIALNGKEE